MQLSIALSKAGDNKTAHQNLQQVLKETPETIQTLLWLARATADEREARTAPDLACVLPSDYEIEKRAIAAIAQKFPNGNEVLEPTVKNAARTVLMTSLLQRDFSLIGGWNL